MLDAYLVRRPTDQDMLLTAMVSQYEVVRNGQLLSNVDRAKIRKDSAAYKGPNEALVEKVPADDWREVTRRAQGKGQGQGQRSKVKGKGKVVATLASRAHLDRYPRCEPNVRWRPGLHGAASAYVHRQRMDR